MWIQTGYFSHSEPISTRIPGSAKYDVQDDKHWQFHPSTQPVWFPQAERCALRRNNAGYERSPWVPEWLLPSRQARFVGLSEEKCGYPKNQGSGCEEETWNNGIWKRSQTSQICTAGIFECSQFFHYIWSTFALEWKRTSRKPFSEGLLLHANECKSDVTFKWLLEKSNLLLTLSSIKDFFWKWI